MCNATYCKIQNATCYSTLYNALQNQMIYKSYTGWVNIDDTDDDYDDLCGMWDW